MAPGLFEKTRSNRRGEIATPIVVGGHWEHGFEFHFFIHFEGDGLWRVAAAFAGVVTEGVPIGTGFTSTGGGLSNHNRLGLNSTKEYSRFSTSARSNFHNYLNIINLQHF